MSSTTKRAVIAVVDAVVFFVDMILWPLCYAALGVAALVALAWAVKEVAR